MVGKNIKQKQKILYLTQKFSERFLFKKLKNFKISGSIGGSGEKDKLSYMSLVYQIQNGRKTGYNDWC